MSSRSAILDQIRRQLGRGPLTPEAVAALEARRPAHTRIAVGDELVERFIARFESRAGSIARVASLTKSFLLYPFAFIQASSSSKRR